VTAVTTAILVDDHQVFREGLGRLFEMHGVPRLLAQSSRADEACELAAATRPDVVILDLIFAGAEEGLSTARRLLDRNPSERILFLTAVKDALKVADAFDAGALGYATKDQGWRDIIDAVEVVSRGRQYLSTTLINDPVEQDRLKRRGRSLEELALLTERERQIFDLTAAGLTAAQIGSKLSISARTVESHRMGISGKLGLRSVMDIVRYAARAGLL